MSGANLAGHIAELASTNASTREAAAAELYRIGRGLGDAALDHALAGWRSVADFASLLGSSAAVGIAVQPDTFEQIRAANGSPRLANVPADQDAREFELHFPGGIALDILTTRAAGEGGAIARYLEKFGDGIQQVEYEVQDVDRMTEILRGRFGLQPIYPEARPGADDTRVNFFLANTPEGEKVLIEFVQAPREREK